MTQYLISCQCGESNAVRIQQAGETVRCSHCGHDLVVPDLRNLRKLPPVEVESERADRRWTPMQGWLFTLGVPIAIISIGVIVFFQIERGKLNLEKPSAAIFIQFQRDFSQIGLLEAWDIWTKVEKLSLDRRGRPIYLVHRELDKRYWNIILIAGGFGFAGLAAVAIALAHGRNSHRR